MSIKMTIFHLVRRLMPRQAHFHPGKGSRFTPTNTSASRLDWLCPVLFLFCSSGVRLSQLILIPFVCHSFSLPPNYGMDWYFRLCEGPASCHFSKPKALKKQQETLKQNKKKTLRNRNSCNKPRKCVLWWTSVITFKNKQTKKKKHDAVFWQHGCTVSVVAMTTNPFCNTVVVVVQSLVERQKKKKIIKPKMSHWG